MNAMREGISAYQQLLCATTPGCMALELLYLMDDGHRPTLKLPPVAVGTTPEHRAGNGPRVKNPVEQAGDMPPPVVPAHLFEPFGAADAALAPLDLGSIAI